MEKEVIFTTQPLSSIDKKLQERFAEDIANQASLMDSMGKQLLSIELAMVGIYATILKLIAGDKAILQNSGAVGFSFVLWFIAVIVTLFAIFPQKYRVDTTKLDEIKEFFYKSAKRKAIMLTISILFFLAGVFVAILAI